MKNETKTKNEIGENQLKIFNAFGIKPSNSFVSAGMDFYVPNIITNEQKQLALEAFKKSYNITEENMVEFIGKFKYESLRASHVAEDIIDNNIPNIVMLYYGLHSYELESIANIDVRINKFITDYLVWTDKNVPGLKLQKDDTLFINSGIKVALPVGTAGVYLNKSGKGNAGFDVRAQVVDEDYAGYVHLSLAYTKMTKKDAIVYCGDKLTQMLIIPVLHLVPTEIDEDEYNKLMENSDRGDKGFGSQDVKH